MPVSAAAPQIPQHVSRETTQRLEAIVAQVLKWQPRINLISPGTVDTIWERHIEDSLQLVPLAPDAKRWLDLGSGGGFPGLVIAAMLADRPDCRITLVESNGKKCSFLRETARLVGLSVDVRQERIEHATPKLVGSYDVVTARALADIGTLLSWTAPLIAGGAIALFPKGQDVDEELRLAQSTWHIDSDLIQSQTESRAAILRIRSATRRSAP